MLHLSVDDWENARKRYQESLGLFRELHDRNAATRNLQQLANLSYDQGDFERAEEFARLVFVEQNLEKGYAMLADGTKRYVSIGQFKEVIAKLHPNGYPRTVRATEHEPMKGEKAIYIYLVGDNSGHYFNYRLTMEGTAATDYRVLRFDRTNEPRRSSIDRLKFAGTN